MLLRHDSCSYVNCPTDINPPRFYLSILLADGRLAGQMNYEVRPQFVEDRHDPIYIGNVHIDTAIGFGICIIALDGEDYSAEC